jgi:hypothetical protein
MAWAHIQKAEEATWEMYEHVQRAVGDAPIEGLIAHAAGEVDGKWQSISIWESREAWNRFREERLMPVVTEILGEAVATAGPPPEEWFEVKHLIAP